MFISAGVHRRPEQHSPLVIKKKCPQKLDMISWNPFSRIYLLYWLQFHNHAEQKVQHKACLHYQHSLLERCTWVTTVTTNTAQRLWFKSLLLYSKFSGFGYNVDDVHSIAIQTILTAPKSHIYFYSFLLKVTQTSASLLRNPDILRTSKIAFWACCVPHLQRALPISIDFVLSMRNILERKLTLLEKRHGFTHRCHLYPQQTKEFHIRNYAKHSKYEAVSPKGEAPIEKSHHFCDLLETRSLLPFHATSCVAVSSKPTVCFI